MKRISVVVDDETLNLLEQIVDKSGLKLASVMKMIIKEHATHELALLDEMKPLSRASQVLVRVRQRDGMPGIFSSSVIKKSQ